jgi:hypothetical protein
VLQVDAQEKLVQRIHPSWQNLPVQMQQENQ